MYQYLLYQNCRAKSSGKENSGKKVFCTLFSQGSVVLAVFYQSVALVIRRLFLSRFEASIVAHTSRVARRMSLVPPMRWHLGRAFTLASPVPSYFNTFRTEPSFSVLFPVRGWISDRDGWSCPFPVGFVLVWRDCRGYLGTCRGNAVAVSSVWLRGC